MSKVRNITVLESLFFVRGKLPAGLKLERNKCEVTTQLPLTKTGLIKVSEKPHFEVGLGATLTDSKAELFPENYRGIIEVRSVIQKGIPFKDVDDGIDVLPDVFLDSLGGINDEIESPDDKNASQDDFDLSGLDRETRRIIENTPGLLDQLK